MKKSRKQAGVPGSRHKRGRLTHVMDDVGGKNTAEITLDELEGIHKTVEYLVKDKPIRRGRGRRAKGVYAASSGMPNPEDFNDQDAKQKAEDIQNLLVAHAAERFVGAFIPPQTREPYFPRYLGKFELSKFLNGNQPLADSTIAKFAKGVANQKHVSAETRVRLMRQAIKAGEKRRIGHNRKIVGGGQAFLKEYLRYPQSLNGANMRLVIRSLQACKLDSAENYYQNLNASDDRQEIDGKLNDAFNNVSSKIAELLRAEPRRSIRQIQKGKFGVQHVFLLKSAIARDPGCLGNLSGRQLRKLSQQLELDPKDLSQPRYPEDRKDKKVIKAIAEQAKNCIDQHPHNNYQRLYAGKHGYPDAIFYELAARHYDSFSAYSAKQLANVCRNRKSVLADEHPTEKGVNRARVGMKNAFLAEIAKNPNQVIKNLVSKNAMGLDNKALTTDILQAAETHHALVSSKRAFNNILFNEDGTIKNSDLSCVDFLTKMTREIITSGNPKEIKAMHKRLSEFADQEAVQAALKTLAGEVNELGASAMGENIHNFIKSHNAFKHKGLVAKSKWEKFKHPRSHTRSAKTGDSHLAKIEQEAEQKLESIHHELANDLGLLPDILHVEYKRQYGFATVVTETPYGEIEVSSGVDNLSTAEMLAEIKNQIDKKKQDADETLKNNAGELKNMQINGHPKRAAAIVAAVDVAKQARLQLPKNQRSNPGQSENGVSLNLKKSDVAELQVKDNDKISVKPRRRLGIIRKGKFNINYHDVQGKKKAMPEALGLYAMEQRGHPKAALSLQVAIAKLVTKLRDVEGLSIQDEQISIDPRSQKATIDLGDAGAIELKVSRRNSQNVKAAYKPEGDKNDFAEGAVEAFNAKLSDEAEFEFSDSDESFSSIVESYDEDDDEEYDELEDETFEGPPVHLPRR